MVILTCQLFVEASVRVLVGISTVIEERRATFGEHQTVRTVDLVHLASTALEEAVTVVFVGDDAAPLLARVQLLGRGCAAPLGAA